VLLKAENAATTLLVHFPGLGANAESYAKSVHDAMGRTYDTLSFLRYGETYAREALMGAIEQAIQSSDKDHTVLHGGSFGAAVIYDLISDPACREFLKRNNVIGAILETPILDKKHLRSAASKMPDRALINAAVLMNSARSGNLGRELVELSSGERRSILQEALREKTENRKIETPVYAVFSENDNLGDNLKIRDTLQSQAEKMDSMAVASSDKMGHHVADDQYWPMWQKEKEVVRQFEELDRANPNVRQRN
jgi:hypothetical protein